MEIIIAISNIRIIDCIEVQCGQITTIVKCTASDRGNAVPNGNRSQAAATYKRTTFDRCTLFGIVIEVKPLQPTNAPYPIDVTLFGMVIEVKPLQP